MQKCKIHTEIKEINKTTPIHSSFCCWEIHPFRKVHATRVHLQVLLAWEQASKSGITEELLGERHHVRQWLRGDVLVLVLLRVELVSVGWESLGHWVRGWAEESVDNFEAAGCEAVCAEGGMG